MSTASSSRSNRIASARRQHFRAAQVAAAVAAHAADRNRAAGAGAAFANVRGQWGELQLRRVVEAAGMLEDCDFDLKESVSADGSRLTPDMIVRLPGGKNVIVDAKVPSSAYLDAMETEDHGVREAKMRDHARQVRDHVSGSETRPTGSTFSRRRISSSCSCRERCCSVRDAARPGAARFQPRARSHARQPADPHRAASSGRLRLAAGKSREERAGDQRPRASAVPAHPGDGDAFRRGRARADAVGRGLQQSGRLTREPRARDRPTVKDKGITAPEEVPDWRRSIRRRARSARRN